MKKILYLFICLFWFSVCSADLDSWMGQDIDNLDSIDGASVADLESWAGQTIPSGGAGIAFDASSSGYLADDASLTFSHTTGTGSNRILVVVVGGNTIVEGDITGVTYNGVAMTAWWDISATTTYLSSGWYLVNPASGAHDVVVSQTSGAQAYYGVSSSFTGVHQTVPVGASAEASGFSATPSVDVTAAVGDLVVDGVFGDTDTAPDGSQALIVSQTQGRRLAMSSETAAGTTVTMSWTHTSGWWVTGGGPLKPAG